MTSAPAVLARAVHTGLVDASDALRKRLGLERLPHYSTLKKFADRSSVLEVIDAMLVSAAEAPVLDGDSPVGLDSTVQLHTTVAGSSDSV